ncbi:MAG: beta-N-acetylhexosaminidase [Oligoflexia bacterium]|nr:beta-N-acetylhexosaminidase [Oligoflexia bacterium]
MSSELGQLIFTGISGTSLTSEEQSFIEKENIGGVILFSENFESPAQLAELVNSIQVLRKEYPLYIAVDQEGGRVWRFKEHFTQIPSMYELSSLNSPKILFHVAKIIAEELTACGVNLNLAPVCDVWTNPNNKVIGDRAFGTNADDVEKYCSAVIRGLQTNGVLACAKHFPGHGSTTKDSHFDLPIVKTPIDQLRAVDFAPFNKAVKSRVEFVMMAHLVVDAIDEELPCSLSEKAHKILRDELRFNKVIISDDMEMHAITKHFGAGEAAVKAILAGTNIIEYRSMEGAKEALEGLKEAHKTKRLKNEVLNQRLAQIMESKKTNLGEYNPVYIPEISKKVGVAANKSFMDEILEKLAQVNGQTA